MRSAAEPLAFAGATIRLYGADVLVVVVLPELLADVHESQLVVIAFRARFARTIVLVARDAWGVPTYYGPAAIARALSALPFDALSWRRYLYRRAPPPRLPIPIEPASSETDSHPSWSFCDTQQVFVTLRSHRIQHTR